VTIWPFAQAFLITVVVWVSIGVYGSYFVLRSISWSGSRRDRLSYADHEHQWNLPESARSMGLLGYLFGGLFGPVAVVLVIVLCVVGAHWFGLRRVGTWLLMSSPKWRGRPPPDHKP